MNKTSPFLMCWFFYARFFICVFLSSYSTLWMKPFFNNKHTFLEVQALLIWFKLFFYSKVCMIFINDTLLTSHPHFFITCKTMVKSFCYDRWTLSKKTIATSIVKE